MGVLALLDLRMVVGECSLALAGVGSTAPSSPNNQINTELSWRQHDRPWFGGQHQNSSSFLTFKDVIVVLYSQYVTKGYSVSIVD